jgi:hypothetical protein
MSSESGSKEGGSVMEDPSGCLADKTANLSTRPSRIRKENTGSETCPLGIIIAGLHELVKRGRTWQKACSNEVSDSSKPDLRLNLTSRPDKRGHARNLWRQAGVITAIIPEVDAKGIEKRGNKCGNV